MKVYIGFSTSSLMIFQKNICILKKKKWNPFEHCMDDMKKMKMLKSLTSVCIHDFFKQLKYIEPYLKSTNVNFSSNNNNSF